MRNEKFEKDLKRKNFCDTIPLSKFQANQKTQGGKYDLFRRSRTYV